MKKVIAIGMLVAGIAAFGGSSYEDWFTPSSGWGKQTVPINIQFSTVNWNGNMPVTATLNDALDLLDSVITEDVPQSAKNAFALSKAALANSIFAACQAQMNKVKIDNLGAALEGVFVNTYGQYQDEAGNVISKTKSGIDTSALRQQLIANKNAVVSGGQASGGSESNPLKLIITQKPYDELQFEQHTADGKSLTSLKGWYDLQDNAQPETLGGADYFAFGTMDYYFPITWGKSTELEWARWNGWDASCFSAGDDGGTGSQDSKPLHLRYWNGGDGGCGENLQNLLTNKAESIASDRRKHYFLARYGENDAAMHDLHWVSMAESAMEVGGGEPNVDDHSIVLAQDEDASPDDPKKLRLKGFDAAKTARTESDKVPTIPNLKPTGDDLAWTSFKDFFADSVFKTSDTTGKVLLNGTNEGDKKVQVLALQYGETDDDQTLSHFSGDGKSIDFGFTPDGQTMESPLAQLHNFDNPERSGAKTQYDIADILTNVNHSTEGWYFPLRNAQGVLQYADAKKLIGIPSASVDGKTIENTADEGETEPTKLRLYGSQGDTAVKGSVVTMGEDGTLAWKKVKAGLITTEHPEEEEYMPVSITQEDDEEVAVIGLNGWSTFDHPWILYGTGVDGKPHSWDVDSFVGLEGISDDWDALAVEGLSTASKASVPYATVDSIDNRGIEWLAPPQTNPNGKFLKVTGTGDSATLAWGDAGGQVAPDGYSISTNETGQAGKVSIKGWNGSNAYPSSTSSTTLASSLQSSSTKSFYLVARNNYGSISYIPIGTMSVQSAPRCFQYNENTCQFENLYYRWGRTEKTATNSAGYTYSGTVYLVIQHSTGSGVLQKSSVSNSDTQTCIKIATVSGGKVTMDYTNMPVIPAYE